MITHIDITGVGKFSPDDSIKAYVRKRVGGLDRFAPRKARGNIRADVKLSEHGTGSNKKYQVEVLLALPEKTVTAKSTESTEMEATDQVEQKLSAQLRKYKDESVAHLAHRRVLGKFKRSFARER